MRLSPLCLALLLPLMPAAGQGFVRLSAGVTGSSPFVKDFIDGPVNSKQTIAPTGVLLVGWRLPSGYRLGIEGRYARGTWRVDDNGTKDDLGRLTTVGIALVADGPIAGALRWEGAAGKLHYSPAQQIGMFSRGGVSRWMLGGGVTWHRPIAPALDLILGARYDFHGFNNAKLESVGYSRSQWVHRLGLTVGVERGF